MEFFMTWINRNPAARINSDRGFFGRDEKILPGPSRPRIWQEIMRRPPAADQAGESGCQQTKAIMISTKIPIFYIGVLY
jgi:hypothetical protein